MAKSDNKKNGCKYTCKLISCSLFVAIGFTIFFTYLWMVHFVLETIVSLKPNGFLFNLWQKNPMPLTFEVYMFNWTNPEDIYKKNVTPTFKEIGPFVFKETKQKVNITWNSNNTVTYRHLRYWYFDETHSVANLSTKVFIPNPVALAAAYRIRTWSFLARKGLDFSLRSLSQEIYVEKPVGEILFAGYNDPVLDVAKALPFPDSLPMPDVDKFGWFYPRNGSIWYDGTFNMDINFKNFGKLLNWNYVNQSSYFDKECGKIKGSAGDFFPPNLQKTNVSFFSIDICRPVILDYSEDVFVDGTRGYKYVASQSFLDNGTKVPENKCYTVDERIPSGVLNVSPCKSGAPGFLSLPHFYGADTYYMSKISGVHPNEREHQIFMVLEPITGMPLHAEGRFQLNVLIHPINYISLYTKVPKVYMPVLWFEQKAKIPSDIHFLLKIFLHLPIILQCLSGSFIFVGISWFVYILWGPKLKEILFKKRKPGPSLNVTEAEDSLIRRGKKNSII